MPVSADVVEIAIGLEDPAKYGDPTGVTKWEVLPITSEGMAANVSTTLSNLMNKDRQVLDSILAGMSAEGDIATELVICPAFKVLMQSAMSSLEGDITPAIVPSAVDPKDPADMATLKIGLKQVSFCVRKRMPDPSDTAGVKELFQLITGCVVNTLAVTSTPGEAITYTCGILGKQLIAATTDTALAKGVPVTAAIDPLSVEVLRGPDTINLEFGGVTGDPFFGEDITVRCFGAFGYNINNNYRGVQCIGTLGNKAVVLGRCEVALNATIHLWDNKLLDALLAQDNHTFKFRAQKADDPITKFGGMFSTMFPKIKVASNSIVAGGTGTDMVNELTANALYDASEKSTLTLQYGQGAVATAAP